MLFLRKYFRSVHHCLEFQGWEPFLELQIGIFPNVMQAYYSGILHKQVGNSFEAYVNQTDFALNKDTLSEILHVPSEGEDP